MAQQIDSHLFKGMSKDLGEHVFNTELLVDAHNIRIKTDEQNSTYIITNEKGPEEVTIDWSDCYTNNWIGPSLGAVPYSVEGKVNADKLYFNIVLYTSKISLGKNIYIHFGEDNFVLSEVNYDYSFTDNMSVSFAGESYNTIKEVFIETNEDNNNTLIIPSITTSTIALGTLKIPLNKEIKENIVEFKNEGTTHIEVGERGTPITAFHGNILGTAVVDNYIVVFTHEENSKTDFIYRLEKINDSFKALLLFSGNLNLDNEHPIETLSSIENDLIYKVYWVDGINQMRFINIKGDYSAFLPDSFNSTLAISGNESFIITNKEGSGNLNNGIIQYAFTYVNKYGQESAPALVSPLNYVFNNDRGGSPDSKGSRVFSIKITGLKDNTSLVRLYAISRSSLNAEPEVRLVGEKPIDFKKVIEEERVLQNWHITRDEVSNTVVNSSTSNIIVRDLNNPNPDDPTNYEIGYYTSSTGLERAYNNIGYKRIITREAGQLFIECYNDNKDVEWYKLNSPEFSKKMSFNDNKSYIVKASKIPLLYSEIVGNPDEKFLIEYYFKIPENSNFNSDGDKIGYCTGAINTDDTPPIPTIENNNIEYKEYKFNLGKKVSNKNNIVTAPGYLVMRQYYLDLGASFKYTLNGDAVITQLDAVNDDVVIDTFDLVADTEEKAVKSIENGCVPFKYNPLNNRLEFLSEGELEGIEIYDDNLDTNGNPKLGNYAKEGRPCTYIHIVKSSDYNSDTFHTNHKYYYDYNMGNKNDEVINDGNICIGYDTELVDADLDIHNGSLLRGDYIQHLKDTGVLKEGEKLYLAIDTKRVYNFVQHTAKSKGRAYSFLNVYKDENENIKYGDYTIIGKLTDYIWNPNNGVDPYCLSNVVDCFVVPEAEGSSLESPVEGRYALNLTYFNDNDFILNDDDSNFKQVLDTSYLIRKFPITKDGERIDNPSAGGNPAKYEGTDIIKVWEKEDLKRKDNIWFPYQLLPKETLSIIYGPYGSDYKVDNNGNITGGFFNYVTRKYAEEQKKLKSSDYDYKIVAPGYKTEFPCYCYSVIKEVVKRAVYHDTVYTESVEYSENQAQFYDDGRGEIVDGTKLLFLGSGILIPETISSKDNTLFIGNIKRDYNYFNFKEIRKIFKDATLDTTHLLTKCLVEEDGNNLTYNYENYLKLGSQNIKGFKYLDTYRFGVQFKDKYGNWSDPIFIKDFQITLPPEIVNAKNTSEYKTFYGEYFDKNGYYVNKVGVELNQELFNSEEVKNVINTLINNGYTQIRPVVVFPTIEDRECVAQGVVNPTVFNIEDRLNHAPDIQASWFFRPEPSQEIGIPYSTEKVEITVSHPDDEGRVTLASITTDVDKGFGEFLTTHDNWKINNTPSYKSQASMFWCGGYKFAHYNIPYGDEDIDIVPNYSNKNNDWNMKNWNDYKDNYPSYSNGSWVEFRHWYPIPDHLSRCAEIQGIRNPEYDYCCIKESSTLKNIIGNRRNHYYIDKNVVTLNSPDIEFSDEIDSLNKSTLKFRIVGRIPIYGNTSKAKLDLKTAPNVESANSGNTQAPGFFEHKATTRNVLSWRALISGPMFIDFINWRQRNYVLYPWHKSGTISGTDDNTGASIIKTKKLSNLRYSRNSVFKKNTAGDYIMWTPDVKEVTLFNSNEVSLSKVGGLSYYGNIDQLRTQPSYTETSGEDKTRADGYGYTILGVKIQYKDSDKTVLDTNYPLLDDSRHSDVKYMGGGYRDASCWSVLKDGYLAPELGDAEDSSKDGTRAIVNTSPIRIKYKSTKHAIIGLEWTEEKSMTILPCAALNGDIINTIERSSNNNFYTTPRVKLNHINQEAICELAGAEDYDYSGGFLWLGELYKEVDKEIRFGGTSDKALQNNIWEPAGKAISLKDIIDNNKETPRLIWSEGDTYYQRYDCLKTYPFSNEDVNQVTEILSFMCETRVNLDGRYDANRGLEDNTNVSPENFNKLNPVYNQSNNYFIYRIFDEDSYKNKWFKSDIMWSMSKTGGETVDPWLQIPANSKYTLDGKYGPVNAIKKYNDALLVFQDSAVSAIQFNERAAISTSDGVPIEIANTGKMQGVKYLDTNIGCCNKWAITISSKALYFLDAHSSSLMSFSSEGVKNLTTSLGMTSWAKDNDFFKKYTPKDYEGFRLFVDKNSQDIYIVNNKETLLYSELLGQFVSFLDYKNINDGFNLYSNFLGLRLSDKTMTSLP